MLASLFSVEMWERFSFYGMQGILLYYMYFTAAEGGLGIDKGLAAGLVGAYGGGVYLSTILGAWLADRLFGSEKVLFGSAILIMAGHIALALVPGIPGLIAGLVLVGVGSGGLKANATALVGSLYREKDERRDAGFSIFYMGINAGALIGPLVTGWLQESHGFHWGFGAAAVGMAVGLAIYAVGRKKLPEEAHRVPNPLPAAERTKYGLRFAAIAAVIAVLLATGIVNAENLAMSMAYAAIGASVLYFALIFSSKKVTGTERRRVAAFIPLYIASAAFWALFQQQFTFIAVYSEEKLDRNLFGWEMPAAWVQSINPVFIIIFAGVMAALWTRLGRKQPGSALKFSIGLFVMGLAFLAFIPLAGGRQDAPAGPGGNPVPVHARGTVPVPHRPVRDHQAGSEGIPHPDGGAVLPLGVAGHHAGRHALRPVQPGGRAALLHRHRRHGHAAGRWPGRGLAGDQEADGRRPLTGELQAPRTA